MILCNLAFLKIHFSHFMPERSFDDFNEYADQYRQIHTKNIALSGANSFYFAEMKVKLLQEFEKNDHIKVLDVGCGDGSTELFMTKYFSSWKIEAIDVSEDSIGIAKQKKLNAVIFRWYDGTTIPFPEETFDVVFMAGVLHHISFSLHQHLIDEVHRVTKKEGRFYLFEHNPLNPVTRHLVNTCIFDKSAKLLPYSYTRQLLKRNKFEIIKHRFIIFFPRKGILSLFLFLEKYLARIPFGGQYFIVSRK
jgi:ubiquinone/menaquinone biosynthesis C-methylase UbiE